MLKKLVVASGLLLLALPPLTTAQTTDPEAYPPIHLEITDVDICGAPQTSQDTVKATAKKAGLSVQPNGFWNMEYSDGKAWRTNPYAGCIWAVRSHAPGGEDYGSVAWDIVYIEDKTGVWYYDGLTTGRRVTPTEVVLPTEEPIETDITVTPSSGNVPLTVSVEFPSEWQSLVTQLCRARDPNLADERTLTIDWGDGTVATSDGPVRPCPEHTYTEAGSYQVAARFGAKTNIARFAADYNKRVLYEGATSVTVTGGEIPALSTTSEAEPEASVGSDMWLIVVGGLVVLLGAGFVLRRRATPVRP